MTNEDASYAKTGGSFDISYTYKPGKTFGLSATLKATVNEPDTDALKEQFEIPGANLNLRAGDYSTVGLFLGGSANLPFTEKFSFDAKAMIGFASSTYPEISAMFSDGTTTAYAKQEEAEATAFAYLIGAGLKYNVSNRIALLGSVDYLGSKPEFVNVEISDSEGNTSKQTASQPISIINVSVGIGFMF